MQCQKTMLMAAVEELSISGYFQSLLNTSFCFPGSSCRLVLSKLMIWVAAKSSISVSKLSKYSWITAQSFSALLRFVFCPILSLTSCLFLSEKTCTNPVQACCLKIVAPDTKWSKWIPPFTKRNKVPSYDGFFLLIWGLLDHHAFFDEYPSLWMSRYLLEHQMFSLLFWLTLCVSNKPRLLDPF